MRTDLPRVWALAWAASAALLGAPAAGGAKPHPTPTPSPAPVADPAVTKIVRAQFVQWQAGIVDKALYAPQLSGDLTDAKIADTSSKLGVLGPLTSTVYIGRWINPDFPPGMRGYIYQMRCAAGNVYLWVALRADGKIASLFFKNRLDVETVTPPPSSRAASPPASENAGAAL